MDLAHAPTSNDPGHGGAHGDSHGHRASLSYEQVFLILFVATVVEVALAYMGIPKGIKIVLFVVMALYKAVMVALYFMHLKFEKKLMWVIAAAPLMFGVILAIGTYPDSEKGTKRFQRGDSNPWSETETPGPQK